MKGVLLSLALPKDQEHDLSATRRWLSALWQSLPYSPLRRLLGKQDHFSLEIGADPAEIRLYLWFPTSNLSQIAREQIASQFPGVQIEQSPDYWQEGKDWASCELAARRHEEATLAAVKDSEADPLAGILASLSDLGQQERAAVQLLVRRSLVAFAPGEGPSFEVIVRLLAQAQNARAARARLSRIVASFGQFRGEIGLRPRAFTTNSRSALAAFVGHRWPYLRFAGTALSLPELAAIYHIPSSKKVRNRYLLWAGAKRFSPSLAVPPSGIPLGTGSVEGRERAVFLRPEDRPRPAGPQAA